MLFRSTPKSIAALPLSADSLRRMYSEGTLTSVLRAGETGAAAISTIALVAEGGPSGQVFAAASVASNAFKLARVLSSTQTGKKVSGYVYDKIFGQSDLESLTFIQRRDLIERNLVFRTL